MGPSEHPRQELAREAIEPERKADPEGRGEPERRSDPERQAEPKGETNGHGCRRLGDLRLGQLQRTPAPEEVIENDPSDLPELRQLVRVARGELIARDGEAASSPAALEAFVDHHVVTRLERVLPGRQRLTGVAAELL